MFRVDLTTAETALINKLVWPDCEDFVGLQVVGDAPTWILDVSAMDAVSTTAERRRYLFCDLQQAVHVGLAEDWTERTLHMLLRSQAGHAVETTVTRVEQVWEREAPFRKVLFEVVGAAETRYFGLEGEATACSGARRLQIWPTLSSRTRLA